MARAPRVLKDGAGIVGRRVKVVTRGISKLEEFGEVTRMSDSKHPAFWVKIDGQEKESLVYYDPEKLAALLQPTDDDLPLGGG